MEWKSKCNPCEIKGLVISKLRAKIASQEKEMDLAINKRNESINYQIREIGRLQRLANVYSAEAVDARASRDAHIERIKELQDALKEAIEFIDEVSCVHNTLMELRARDKAREVKAKINELIGE